MMRLAGRGVVDPVYSAICQRCSHIIDKNNGNFDDLNDWEHILKRRVNNRVRAMQISHTLEQLRYGIDISLLDKQIDITHKHFVITTVNKASNNFAFICKNFYISKIRGISLGIRGGRIESNDVYAYCRGSSPQEIVDNQCMQLERLGYMIRFQIVIKESLNYLRYLNSIKDLINGIFI